MMDSFSLKGKTILVTGASSGIGQGIALGLSQAGARVVLQGRNVERLELSVGLLEGNGHITLVADLRDEKSLEDIASQLPLLDGIVHSAGIIKRFPLKYMLKEAFTELMDVNVISGSEILRYCIKAKKLRRNASVVFISSVGSDYASYGNTMYMASKGAVNSMVKGLAFELARTNIRVNAIQPGLVVTHLTKQINSDELDLQLKNYPLGRFGKPEDIAYACIYLLSDASSWMTGSAIKLDGGLTLK